MRYEIIFKIFLFLFILSGLLVLPARSNDQEKGKNIARSIADAYGFGEFDKVESIKFTFNAGLGDRTIQRQWKWNVEEGTVHYKTADSSDEWKSYQQDEITKLSEQIMAIDSLFINDKYWLLFPFQMIWDSNTTIEMENELTPLPIGEGKGYKVTVKYPAEGGYTPGDIYELYIDDEYIIKQWVYRRAGSEEPTRMATWEDNKKAGPLLISFDHRGPDGEFRVWFTDVSVELKGAGQ